jgi:hypothetical protein
MEPGMYLGLWPILALFILGYAQAGLYPGFGLGPVETFRRFSLVMLFSFTILAAMTFAFKLPHQYSRITFGIAFLLSIVVVPAFRYLTLAVTRRWAWWHQPVVLVGTGSSILRAIPTLQESPLLGYRPFGILSRRAAESPSEFAGLPVLGGLERAAEVAGKGVSVALIDPESLEGRSELDALQQHFRHLLVIQSYGSLPVEGVQIRNLGGVLGVEFSNNLLERRNRWVKRALDLGLGSLFLVVFGPLILACALWVKVMSRGPAFFYQERVGLRGRRFLVPKIRTMQPNAHEELEAHLASDPIMRDEWERSFKLRSDPRIIPVIGVFASAAVERRPGGHEPGRPTALSGLSPPTLLAGNASASPARAAGCNRSLAGYPAGRQRRPGPGRLRPLLRQELVRLAGYIRARQNDLCGLERPRCLLTRAL